MSSSIYVVGDDSSFFWSDDVYHGNIYKMERDVLLEQFHVYLASGTACFIDFYIHERNGPWDEWETIWAGHHYFSYYMLGWYHSSYIDEWLEDLEVIKNFENLDLGKIQESEKYEVPQSRF